MYIIWGVYKVTIITYTVLVLIITPSTYGYQPLRQAWSFILSARLELSLFVAALVVSWQLKGVGNLVTWDCGFVRCGWYGYVRFFFPKGGFTNEKTFECFCCFFGFDFSNVKPMGSGRLRTFFSVSPHDSGSLKMKGWQTTLDFCF